MGGGKGGRKGAAKATSDHAAQKNAVEEKALNEALKRIAASNSHSTRGAASAMSPRSDLGQHRGIDQ
jgi:hypothetical protein